jgi:hypothetical protein
LLSGRRQKEVIQVIRNEGLESSDIDDAQITLLGTYKCSTCSDPKKMRNKLSPDINITIATKIDFPCERQTAREQKQQVAGTRFINFI